MKIHPRLDRKWKAEWKASWDRCLWIFVDSGRQVGVENQSQIAKRRCRNRIKDDVFWRPLGTRFFRPRGAPRGPGWGDGCSTAPCARRRCWGLAFKLLTSYFTTLCLFDFLPDMGPLEPRRRRRLIFPKVLPGGTLCRKRWPHELRSQTPFPINNVSWEHFGGGRGTRDLGFWGWTSPGLPKTFRN